MTFKKEHKPHNKGRHSDKFLKDKKSCSKCQNFGWWPLGNLTPMGEMDSNEWGKKVIKCPWCNMGYAKGERYETLKKVKQEEKGVKDEKK